MKKTKKAEFAPVVVALVPAILMASVSNGVAVDVVIPSGDTVTSTQTISNDGDTLTVEEGGAIDTTGSSGDGVDATASDQTITNGGAISANGNGITSTGANVDILNGGSITSFIFLGGDGIGILADGDNAFVENTGLIDAESYGIRAKKTDSTVINRGTINSINHGIRSDGDNSMVINYGTVNGDSQGVVVGIHAIRSGGQFSEIVNYGTLLAETDGVFSAGDNTTVENHGLIIPGAWGIGSQGDNSTVVNAGTILAGSAVGTINLVGTNNTLILRPGSVLEGDLGFFGINETLSLDPGQNLVLRYQGTFSTLETGMPVVHDTANQMIYSIDPTGFALSQSFIQTTADAVHQAVRSGTGAGSPFGGLHDGNTFGYGAERTETKPGGPRGWASAFGGYQTQEGSGAVTGADQAYGGLVTGGGFASDERMYGAFLGGSYAQLETDFDTQQLDAASFFGGVYGEIRAGSYRISGSFAGGISNFSSDRQIANSTVAGGLETATADYDGYFISPSLTVGRAVGERTEISLGGHYAALFLDSYSETGSSSNLTVASRTAQVAAVRAQAAHLVYQRLTDSGRLSLQSWAGIDGIFNFGDDVEASVAAGAFSAFPAAFTESAAVGFAGIGISHTPTSGNWSLNALVEGRYGSDAYKEIKASAAAALTF